MILSFLLYIFASVTAATTSVHKINGKNHFPEDFHFGASTAAYQIEGAWNTDGRGPSIWDEFIHSNPEAIEDCSNGDVATNSYEYFQDDIEAIKNLGLDFYRFSISWSRILPTGEASNVNEKGIEYYNKVINNLIELNIEPIVTMYHFDLPQTLQTLGGLTNPIVIRYFKAYAKLLFERFGARVKYWLTFNEPALFCVNGYGADDAAPAISFSGVGEYLCAHYVLKSHAVVYRLYKKSFYDRFKGRVGISLNSRFYYSDTDDTNAVDRALQFSIGWFANPIFSADGNYPPVMIKDIARNSERDGRSWSRLPTLSTKWIRMIHGSADFLGLNYYTSRYVETTGDLVDERPSFAHDRNLTDIIKSEWKSSGIAGFFSVPQGLGDLLRWIKKEYNNPEVFITENGWPDTGELDDYGRVEFLHDHLQQVLDVVLNNECNVKRYSVWSLIDNFEWTSGYTAKFGLYSVNMTSPRKERTPKKSANFMRTVSTTHQIPTIN